MGIVCLRGKNFTFLLSSGNYLTPQCALVNRKMNALWKEQITKDLQEIESNPSSLFRLVRVNCEASYQKVKTIWDCYLCVFEDPARNPASRVQTLFNLPPAINRPSYHLNRLLRIEEHLKTQSEYCFWHRIGVAPLLTGIGRITEEYEINPKYLTAEKMQDFNDFMRFFFKESPAIAVQFLSLNFRGAKLLEIPKSIVFFSHVKSLDFQDNEITVVLPEISTLPKLESLNLINNPIPDLNMLPSEFFERVEVTIGEE